MNVEEEVDDEDFTSLVAACDDQLAAGLGAGATESDSTSPELRARLQRDLACAQLLRAVLCPNGSKGNSAATGSWATRHGSPAQDSLPWTQLGRFELRRELGRGGCGIVFLAYDPQLGREVALKVPRAEVTITPELRERFQREARAAAGLDHPNVVQVYEVGEIGPVCFLVSAYSPGITLAQWLKQRTEPVPFVAGASLLATLADAVQHAHERGVVHRDLKPSNILLQRSERRGARGEERNGSYSAGMSLLDFVPKITDFGLAKLLEESGVDDPTRTGAIVGTVRYMAPEQAAGHSQNIGPSADLYALGAILYELLTGRPPFLGETDSETLHLVRSTEPVSLSRLRPKVPRDLETVCLKCLQKEPTRRYASAGALAEDLRRFLTGEPIQARPIGQAERLWRWSRRNPILASVSGLAAGALIAVAALSAAFALQQYSAANGLRQEKDLTKAALEDAETQRKQAVRLAATLSLHRGLALCEMGEVGPGMLWLARSLEIAPADAVDLERTIRANLAAWRRQLRLQTVVIQEGIVTKVAFSPDGRTLLTASHDNTARLWDVSTGKPIGQPLRHEAAVLAAAFSPDGRTIVTASNDETARIWEVTTGKSIGPPLRHRGPVLCVAFSSDSRMVVTASGDKTAQVWTIATGNPVGGPLRHQDMVRTATFSPDGHSVLTGSSDHTAQLWEAATGLPIGPPLRHEDEVVAVAFSPDGRSLLTGSWDHSAQLWDTATGKAIGLALRHGDKILCVAFSPDGKTALTSSLDSTARLWKTATGRPAGKALEHANQVQAAIFSPDGRTILTGSSTEARLWETATGDPIGEPLPHGNVVSSLAFSSDGRKIATGNHDGWTRLWRVGERSRLGLNLAHEGGVQKVAYSPDGRTVATASLDNTARLWNAATGHPIGAVLRHQGPVHVVVFVPDGKTVLTGSQDKTARLWDAATGEPRGEPLLLSASVSPWTAVFSPDGKTILTGSKDGTALLWDVATGKPLTEPLRHAELISFVAFSADGKTALTASDDGTARLWDAGSGRPIGNTISHSSLIVARAMSPDGIVVTAGRFEARLWDSHTGDSLGIALPHPGTSVRSAAFSLDGKRILTGSQDGNARLWDTATGNLLAVPLAHRAMVREVSFSTDGTRLLTASFDKTARVWDAATGKPIGPALEHQDWVVTAAFSPNGHSVVTGSTDSSARLWVVPAPKEGTVERIVLWTQVLTHKELDADGAMRALDFSAWEKRRQRLQELGGPPLP